MHPYGIEELKKDIGEITIWNDGTGTKKKGNYKAKIGRSKKIIEVKGYNRISDPVYKLLKKVMEQYK